MVTLQPAAMDDLAEVLASVAEHLPTIDPAEDCKAFGAVRSLRKKIVVPDRDDSRVDCEINGTIAPLAVQNLGGGSGSGGGT